MKETEDQSKGMYGVLPLNQSQERVTRRLHRVNELLPDLATQTVWIRGRLHTCRSKGERSWDGALNKYQLFPIMKKK